jgi:hypothetical protein
LAKQIVAHEHARLIAPDETGRGLAPAQIAFIHHIVMEQRRRVHKLDGGREMHMPVAAIAAELGRGKRQHRPQALSAGIDQMPGKLGD